MCTETGAPVSADALPDAFGRQVIRQGVSQPYRCTRKGCDGLRGALLDCGL